jgi:hypothetical protein
MSWLTKLFGRKSSRPAPRPRRATLELETLGERLVPTVATVPHLHYDWLNIGGGSSARQLTIWSETDNGNGTGTFTGAFLDNTTGNYAVVQGNIRHTSDDLQGYHHFSLAYFGSELAGGAVMGGADFKCLDVSSDPNVYSPATRSGGEWAYSGWDYQFGNVSPNYNSFNNDSGAQHVILF